MMMDCEQRHTTLIDTTLFGFTWHFVLSDWYVLDATGTGLCEVGTDFKYFIGWFFTPHFSLFISFDTSSCTYQQYIAA